VTQPSFVEAPPTGFDSRALVIAEIATGAVWRRLYQSRFPDPLGYGLGPSRFSDPESGLTPATRFAVVYLGSAAWKQSCVIAALVGRSHFR
jgi:hypothetical protein